jgi:hypothetical protein
LPWDESMSIRRRHGAAGPDEAAGIVAIRCARA